MKAEEEAIIKQVLNDSLKDQPKSAENSKTKNPEDNAGGEETDLAVKISNKSADYASKTDDVEKVADSIKAELEDSTSNLTQDQLL